MSGADLPASLAETLLQAQDALGLAAVIYRDGAILQANEAHARLTGYTLAEFQALDHPLDATTPAARRALEERRRRRQAGENVDGWFESELVRKDGVVIPIEVAVKMTSVEGATLRVALIRDISERKRIELAQRQSEERFRRAVHDAAIGIAIFDPEGNYLDVNEALAGILGYTREELMRLGWKHVTHPDDVAPTFSVAPDARRAVERGVRFSKRYLHRDGHVVWAEVVTSPVRAEDGSILQYVTQVVDVTGRVETEAALRRQQRLLAESQAASHVGSWEYVPGRGAAWSDETYRIFGLPPREGPAPLDELLARIPAPDREAFGRAAADPAVSDRTIDHRVTRPDGTQAWVSTRMHVERDAAGKPTRYVGTTFDVTERKLAEEEARRQLVQRKLVRRILREMVERGAATVSTRREMGRALAAEVDARDLAGFREAFHALNIGALSVERSPEGRYEGRGREMLEHTPGFGAPTCHIALGFLEGMVSALEGGTSLGSEIRCQSQGHEECRFVVRPRDQTSTSR